ncbi:MAG TPA: ATP-binding protein [Desulfuromonadaceae bacterium]
MHLFRLLHIQLIMGISLVTAVSLVSLTLVTSERQRAMYRRVVQQSATEIARNIAVETAHYLVVGDYASLEAFLAKAAQHPHITRIQVCGDTGISFGEVGRSGEGDAMVVVPNPQPLSPPPGENPSTRIAENAMWVWQPVTAGTLVGWVRITYSLQEISQMQRDIWQHGLIIGLIWMVVSVLLIIQVLKRPAMAIRNLSDFARKLPSARGAQVRVEYFAEEIQRLGESLNYASNELRTMELSLFAEQERLRTALGEEEQAESRLRELNRTLEERVQEELNRSRGKDLVLMQQARHAMMGEMLMNIAHQWRQPLNAIGARIQEMTFLLEQGEIEPAAAKAYTADVMEILMEMSRTIERFRNFYQPTSNSTSALQPIAAIREAMAIVETTYREQGIEIRLDGRSYLPIQCAPGDFSQCVLIIMANARDAILERRVSDGRIEITVDSLNESSRNRICISDNGGGIPEELLVRVFDPYVTTKFQSQGVGLGLFIARQIVENRLNGSIRARNTATGAEFILEV